ncbi:carboxypeptidase-like regulatory domain-containing protein [Aminobacter sp. AP02]|uniref:carboxypeptidase-like regulatory domain-containing protein n=1 Tax=Aminobacter sp. AP02 TaxID=2135737 RepID=UPI000D7AD964|nr:carboxypeptidase-like regulatory domain-containing protein [Aminobacter sp. AP02]PWK61305.1 hypothetical protein C8K44_13329 [Aminobacter sp. AP02]
MTLESTKRIDKALRISTAALSIASSLVAWPAVATAEQVTIDMDDIGGVVTGAKGPEAGVWVIAETRDLPTRFIKIVVTDEQGRFVVPDLPPATYDVWVRGYGLVDSPKLKSGPGKIVELEAVNAPDKAAAAHYYPALYWYSMLKIPEKGQFPIGEVKSQDQWLNLVKTNRCITCHQLGDEATRTIPSVLGTFKTSAEAWERRIQSGQAGTDMINGISLLDMPTALANFGEWTDRVGAGELPFVTPPRPTGAERNVIVTQWDWASPTSYLHDEIATDKRNPTVNAYGPLYGSPEKSTDNVPILDPVKHVTSSVRAPILGEDTPNTQDEDPVIASSPYWGEEAIWDSRTIIHNPMFDEQGRVWFTHRIRADQTAAFCRKGSDLVSAKLFPIEASGRQLSMYDPKAKKWMLIDTCFGTHHLQFGFDADNTLWTSGGGDVVGWVNTRKLFDTGDQAGSQGWTALIVDTNGDGKRDEGYNEPGKPIDPTKDTRVKAPFYSIAPNPADGTVWGSSTSGYVMRVDPGASPPRTALTEIYRVPAEGIGIRGGDIDSRGVFWAGLSGGQFASFDRSKCKGPLNGPGAEKGALCPEGWTLYPFPGPNFAGIDGKGSAESSYYAWVDQHNTLGLGRDVPIATGNLSDFGNEAVPVKRFCAWEGGR